MSWSVPQDEQQQTKRRDRVKTVNTQLTKTKTHFNRKTY